MSPRNLGLAGSVTSTKAVASARPARAYSRLVSGSVQPHTPLIRIPRGPPIALTGRYASRSTFRQPNPAIDPVSHFWPPTTVGSEKGLSTILTPIFQSRPALARV